MIVLIMPKWLQLARVRKSTKTKETDNQKKDLMFKMWINRIDWKSENKSSIIWNKESDTDVIDSWKRKYTTEKREKILWKSEIKKKIYNIFTELEFIFKADHCVPINMLINFLRWTKNYDNFRSLKNERWCLWEYSEEFITKIIDEIIEEHWLHKIEKEYNGWKYISLCSDETFSKFRS